MKIIDVNSPQRWRILSALLTALTATGALIRIPMPLAPLTLQTMFTYLSGALLPARYAFLSQAAYVILGLTGVPVFADGGGIHYVSRPTFGYLLSLPAAAMTISYLRLKIKKQGGCGLFTIMLIGGMCVLLIGSIWLYLNLNFILMKDVGIRKVIWSGIMIFMPGEVIKAILAMMIVASLNRINRER
jgi:biotin transport system substrate-specific component